MGESNQMIPSVARILDANFNRAREALRVMEDHARFVCDHQALASRLKGMRHRLADALKSLETLELISARDTPNDVGTSNATGNEYRRSDADSVARAAGKRLSEALRVIEEYVKTLNSDISRSVEQMRYAGYDIEKELCLLMHAQEQFRDVRICVLITQSMCVLPWTDVIRRVVDAVGRCCFQLREKHCSDDALLEHAGRFTERCRQAGAVCIINDRPDVAVACGADGVHVGQDDLSIEAARLVVGPSKIVGISTHSVEQAWVAIKSHPDYVAVGPLFPTALKPDTEVASPSLLREVAATTPLPKVAIGGIDPSNASQIFDAGADCVAVCSCVIESDDPGAVAAELLEARAGRA